MKKLQMTTIELKSSLIDRISKINDPEFFQALSVFLDFRIEQKIYQTNEHQKMLIEEGLIELKRGKGIAENLVDEKVEKWLKEN